MADSVEGADGGSLGAGEERVQEEPVSVESLPGPVIPLSPEDLQTKMRADSLALQQWAEAMAEQDVARALAQCQQTERLLNRAVVAPNMPFNPMQQVLINQVVILKTLSTILDRVHFGLSGKSCLRPAPGQGGGNGKDKSGKVG